jgi:CD2 antigen cytoplasmic tail-binding protein 2
MSSKYSAARPKRAGETFARAHHGERSDDEASSKKVKFDVRNPSALVGDAREDDEVLEADVIGAGGAATKRGAVNIDGYDSDSENETFQMRAESRKKRGNGDDDVNLADQLDNYDSRLKGGVEEEDDDEDDDMFADEDEDAEENGKPGEATSSSKGRKRKEVRFLDNKDIEGQVMTSKSGGTVRLDDESSSDEEDAELAIQEEGVDEEVGAGGLKKHAPKIDAFNMRQENEEGAFDESGNYVRKAVDPDAVHDRWLEGVSKKEMKKAAAAHERREEEMRQQRKEDDRFITSDLLAALITRLDRGETALEALARLGKDQAKLKPKKAPKWKQKKQKEANGDMDVDDGEKNTGDAKQAKLKEAINGITEAADRLLKRDYPEIYDTEREMLVREYRSETGDAWVDPPAPESDEDDDGVEPSEWEFRWTDGRDTAKQGPYDGATMKAWQDAGYFNEGVEFRAVGGDESWTRIAKFV